MPARIFSTLAKPSAISRSAITVVFSLLSNVVFTPDKILFALLLASKHNSNLFGTTVTQSYIFNPADRPATTMRETTENSKFHMNAGNSTLNKGGYTVASVQPIDNNRMNQSDYYYTCFSFLE